MDITWNEKVQLMVFQVLPASPEAMEVLTIKDPRPEPYPPSHIKKILCIFTLISRMVLGEGKKSEIR